MKTLILFVLIACATSVFASDSTLWRQKSNMEAVARHRCSAFALGDKGYVGLGHYNSVVNIAKADFWQYDAATDSWTQIADFPPGPRYHSYDFVIGNKAYVGAGRDAPGTRYNDLWEYDPATNLWTQKANFPGSPRAGCKGFAIDGIGYAGLGTAPGAPDDNALYAYDPVSNQWTAKATFPGAKREAFVTFAIHGLGYVATGGNSGSNDIWAFDPTTNIWTQRADVSPIGRMAATGFALNGKGYIMTGSLPGWGLDLGDCWEYDPVTNTSVQLPDFPGTKRHFACSFVANGKAYLNSGTSGINFNDNWSFNPQFKSSHSNRINFDPNVSPHRATDEVFISLEKMPTQANTTLTLKIIDQKSNLVATLPFVGKTTRLERKQLSSGIYFYIIESANARVQDGRFVFE